MFKWAIRPIVRITIIILRLAPTTPHSPLQQQAAKIVTLRNQVWHLFGIVLQDIYKHPKSKLFCLAITDKIKAPLFCHYRRLSAVPCVSHWPPRLRTGRWRCHKFVIAPLCWLLIWLAALKAIFGPNMYIIIYYDMQYRYLNLNNVSVYCLLLLFFFCFCLEFQIIRFLFTNILHFLRLPPPPQASAVLSAETSCSPDALHPCTAQAAVWGLHLAGERGQVIGAVICAQCPLSFFSLIIRFVSSTENSIK